MWRIIKAEIENAKYFWMIVCIPLVVSILFLLWFGEFKGEKEELLLKIIINMSKGFAIMVALLVLRSILGYVGRGSLSILHLKLPVSILQMGFVRISNLLALWLCTFILILLNVHLLPPHITAKAVPQLFFATGIVLSLFGLVIVLADVISLFSKFILYSYWIAFTAGVFLPGILIFQSRSNLAQLITPTNTILLNLLGFTLLALSVYTFTHLKSYRFKQEV